MKTEILQGYRTFIGFLVGTGLVAWCVWLSKDQPANFVALLTVWTGMFTVFVTKNHKSNQEIKK